MPVPDDTWPLERDLLRDRAYAAIRDAIVDGTLAPGERLQDQELCAWLGLSRTPVREALGRLEQDGLVETAPQRFTRSRRSTGARRGTRSRSSPRVHALAAELAVPRLTATDLEAMRAANQRFAAALQGQRRGRRAGRGRRLPRGVRRPPPPTARSPRVLDRLMPRVRRLERLRFGSLAGPRVGRASTTRIIAAAAAEDVAKTAERWCARTGSRSGP